MVSKLIETLSEKVHNAWWKEKKEQGFHAPIDCKNARPIYAVGENEAREKAFSKHCDKCHTDMYPYDELPEHIKEYDRVTVRVVLDALESLGYRPEGGGEKDERTSL